MPRSLLRLLSLVAAAGLVLGACGGDDEPKAEGTEKEAASSSGDVEEFCLAIDEVKASGLRLSEVALEDDDDVPEAKEALLDLIEKLDAAVAAAPEEIRDVADQVTGLTAQVEDRVVNAESAQQLRDEIPLLVSVLAENTQIDREVSADFVEFVQESCGL